MAILIVYEMKYNWERKMELYWDLYIKYKLGSIDVEIIVFMLVTTYVIKLMINKRTDMGSLIGSYRGPRYGSLDLF